MKKHFYLFLVLCLAAATAGLVSCSSDDDDYYVINTLDKMKQAIIGQWRFVEMLNGPAAIIEAHNGANQPAGHTIEFTSDNEVIYTSDDGEIRKEYYHFASEQKNYITDFPVIILSQQPNNPDYYTPWSVEITGNEMKLHYVGFYTTDHIPAKFIYKWVKGPDYKFLK